MKKKKNQNLTLVKLKNLIKNNKILISLFIAIIIFGAFMYTTNKQNNQPQIFGDDVIEMHYFHLSTCPHCHKQNAFHNELKRMYPNLRINEYEITQPGSRDKIQEMFAQHAQLDPERVSTPTTIIGDEVNVGYADDQTTGQRLIQMIEAEQQRIDRDWNPETMVRTIQLRAQQN